MTTRQVPGTLDRLLYTNVRWQDAYETEDGRQPTRDIDVAQVASSELGDMMHAPVLDIDVPAFLVPSSTPGHSHLYIDQPMHWDQYAELLKALGYAGVLEPGYVGASLAREHTAVRLPWVRKPCRSCGHGGAVPTAPSIEGPF